MNTAEIQVMEEQHLAVSRPVAEEQHSKSSSTESSHWSSDRSSDWTSIDSTPRSEPENVRVFPKNKVPRLESNQIQLLEKIGQGAQGSIYNAKLSFPIAVSVENNNFTYVDSAGWDQRVFAAKTFEGKAIDNHFGQWPEELFNLHGLCKYVCKFYGYSIYNPVDDNPDGDSFCLIMEKYDCSLRDSIDEHMRTGTYERRPFHGPVALSITIQIAIGMAFLHELNITHGGLKADNILVMNIGDGNDTPAGVFIADFDVSPTVIGTKFWRAPEILQAVKDKSTEKQTMRLVTKEADVYSFGMVCYEILTGRKPFEGTGDSDYDVVLSGKRPKLPSNLNHKMKDLLARCWLNDPDARPTFKEIVSKLQGFVTGTTILMQLFSQSYEWGDVDENDFESNLVKLKHLICVLAEKYKQGSSILTFTTGDFVMVGFEYVDLLEEFKAQFGFESFVKHPLLPPFESLSRNHLYTKIVYKGNMFLATCPQVIPEYLPIIMLMKVFLRMF